MRATFLLILLVLGAPLVADADVFRWTRDAATSKLLLVDNRPQLVLTAGNAKITVSMRYFQVAMWRGVLAMVRAELSIENTAATTLKIKPHEIKLTRMAPPLWEVSQYDTRTIRSMMQGLSTRLDNIERDWDQASRAADKILENALDMQDLPASQTVQGDVFYAAPRAGTPGRLALELEILLNGDSYQFPFEMDFPNTNALR